MTSTVPDPYEQTRRAEFMREVKTANLSGSTTEHRAKTRELKVAKWAEWFRQEMDAADCNDPVKVLPEALARLEQIAEDRAAAAVRDLKTILGKALK
jgi:hypothetical protein